MEQQKHDILIALGETMRTALIFVATANKLSVDTLVQRALGRELPGIPAEVVARADAARDQIPMAIAKRILTAETVANLDEAGLKLIENTALSNWTTIKLTLATKWPAPAAAPELGGDGAKPRPPAPVPEPMTEDAMKALLDERTAELEAVGAGAAQKGIES